MFGNFGDSIRSVHIRYSAAIQPFTVKLCMVSKRNGSSWAGKHRLVAFLRRMIGPSLFGTRRMGAIDMFSRVLWYVSVGNGRICFLAFLLLFIRSETQPTTDSSILQREKISKLGVRWQARSSVAIDSWFVFDRVPRPKKECQKWAAKSRTISTQTHI